MIKPSKAQLEKLYYKDGLTQAEIALAFDCSVPTISKRMKAYGLVTRSSGDYRWVELPHDELYQLYVKQRLSTKEIGAHFGCCTHTVLKCLKMYHIPIRPPSGRSWAQHVQMEVYTTWSPDLAWVVGLLTSDGNLPKGDNRINLTSTEWELVETFMGCLQLDSAVEPLYIPAKGSNKPLYVLQFADASFRAFLESLGLMSAKSKTLGPLMIPDAVFPDFARGAWDGDGTWYIKRYNIPSGRVYEYLNTHLTSGSPSYLTWMQSKIQQLTGLYGTIHGINLTYRGQKAITLGHWLYYAPDLPSLSYKRAIWNQFVR